MLKKGLIAIIASALGLGLSMSANASSEIKVCAKYQRSDYTWSTGYKLNALKVSGSDLNKATNSYKFNSYDTYLFIPWDQGGYTLLKLNFNWEPSSLESDYKDQRSVNWRVKKGWDWCN